MNYKAALSALLLTLAPALSTADDTTLTVNVMGAEPPTGTVEVSVFDSAETFLKQPYIQMPCRPAEGGSCRVTFSTLLAGDYAVVVVHDANDNRKLDNGFLGFGAEGFAYSNGASNPLFGRASFEDAKISISGPTEIEISLD